MFCCEPEGRYCCAKSVVIAPFWFSMEHLWIVIVPFWLSTDYMSLRRTCHPKIYWCTAPPPPPPLAPFPLSDAIHSLFLCWYSCFARQALISLCDDKVSYPRTNQSSKVLIELVRNYLTGYQFYISIKTWKCILIFQVFKLKFLECSFYQDCSWKQIKDIGLSYICQNQNLYTGHQNVFVIGTVGGGGGVCVCVCVGGGGGGVLGRIPGGFIGVAPIIYKNCFDDKFHTNWILIM